MDTIGWIIIIVFLVGIIVAFILLKRKAPKPIEMPDRKNETKAIWSNKELSQCEQVNQHRIENGFKPLAINLKLKILAQNRTLYWDLKDFNKYSNLHENFLLDRKHLMDAEWELIGENTCYNCKNPVGAFKKKEGHNKLMLGDWDSVALDIRYNSKGGIYNCLIFGRFNN